MASVAARSLQRCLSRTALRTQVTRSVTTLKQRQITKLLNENVKSSCVAGLLQSNKHNSLNKGFLTQNAAQFVTVASFPRVPSIAQTCINIDAADSSDVAAAGEDDGKLLGVVMTMKIIYETKL